MLWGVVCRSQAWVRSHIDIPVAVAVTGSCSSDLTPNLGTSICQGCDLGEKKKEDSVVYQKPTQKSEKWQLGTLLTRLWAHTSLSQLDPTKENVNDKKNWEDEMEEKRFAINPI